MVVSGRNSGGYNGPSDREGPGSSPRGTIKVAEWRPCSFLRTCRRPVAGAATVHPSTIALVWYLFGQGQARDLAAMRSGLPRLFAAARAPAGRHESHINSLSRPGPTLDGEARQCRLVIGLSAWSPTPGRWRHRNRQIAARSHRLPWSQTAPTIEPWLLMSTARPDTAPLSSGSG